MMAIRSDSCKSKKTLKVGSKSYVYYSLQDAGNTLGKDISRLPFSLKLLLENLLRNEDGSSVKASDVTALVDWLDTRSSNKEIAYSPARVLMQDFTGVPAVVDLAAMRDAMKTLGGDPQQINPITPVDLVIDHSVQVDFSGTDDAFRENVELEIQRNIERYEFLRWGQQAFNNFNVVPPGTGICHQVNLEYLAKVVWTSEKDGETYAYPDTLVGTDSHTTMINGLSVLGWGVGGIEAEAVMLGQPISMLIPEVIGFKFTGKLPEGTTATDLVLTVTHMLRERGVVGKFVEYFGEGVGSLALADRATLANMAPEYGATCGIFPIDEETIKYLHLSGRDDETIALVEAYAKAQGMWRHAGAPDPVFTDVLELDLSTVVPSLAGPKRPQDRVSLTSVSSSFANDLATMTKNNNGLTRTINVKDEDYKLANGDIVIAAITSCTNTSNPSVMLGAGLVARNAYLKGLKVKPWVKTSLAPGSKVVTEYYKDSGLQQYLDALGFNLVGYGCTTCIGNSGPLDSAIEDAIRSNDTVAVAVLSGNRNFEGRVHPLTKANYLASPGLVVAYALAGTVAIDLATEPLGTGTDGKPVYLRDIWPTGQEISDFIAQFVTRKKFQEKYADVFAGDEAWQKIITTKSMTYNWDKNSTYINNPPYFEAMINNMSVSGDIRGARLLGLFGDSITTDHISPAGNISKTSPAARYLIERGVQPVDFNSYGARRGNHEVMMRGTFANIRIKNEMAPGTEGGVTTYIPTGEVMPIYDAAMKYKESSTPLIIVAGKEYGTGSSRDWAAKGTLLLGVRAVIAESFERIHRSNLVGMGVIPLVFMNGVNRKTLKLDGSQRFDITGLSGKITPLMNVSCTITYQNGECTTIPLLCRIDTAEEVEYLANGGILQNVIRGLMQKEAA
jgi:aconitate hydratase